MTLGPLGGRGGREEVDEVRLMSTYSPLAPRYSVAAPVMGRRTRDTDRAKNNLCIPKYYYKNY